MKKEFKHPKYDSKKLKKSILEILKATPLWSMATVNSDSTSHINTAYFCFDDDFNFYFLTPPKAKHSKNLENNSSVAITIFNTNQPWGAKPLRGIQIWGKAENTKTITTGIAKETYCKRFKDAAGWLDNIKKEKMKDVHSRFYKVIPTKMKLFDEKNFGEETFIDIDLKK